MPSATKMNAIEFCRGVTILKSKHPIVEQLMTEVDGHSHHGHKVWNTSLLLMDYFKKHPPERGCRILEIGCGWGITGIYLAKKFDCDVTGLDIDKNVFPFLNVHADLNQVLLDTHQAPYEKLSVEYLKTFDIIVGGDICFWDELSEKLFKVIKKAGKAKTRVVLCDPGRQPFYDLVERCQNKYDCQYLERKLKSPTRYTGYILDVHANT